MWEASARYADGTEITKYFPYHENGNPRAENDRAFALEEWLIDQHEDCIWYSVEYVDKA